MAMEKKIKNRTFDEERALYHLVDTEVSDCTFAGPADGESVLKECRNIEVRNCTFSLRYPLWHVNGFFVENCSFDERARAAVWYGENGSFKNCICNGIKILRECNHIRMENCESVSPEFGWKCTDIEMRDSKVAAEYIFLDSRDITLDRFELKGKYSFQYVENLHIKNSILDTKDAFWHAKNVTVEDSVVKGEYLAWFSEDVTLIRCKIIGTQPLCYCKNLKLIDCTMEGCDLSFEYSDVEATVKGHVDSIKNPKSGTITVDSVGEIIREDAVTECHGIILVNGKEM